MARVSNTQTPINAAKAAHFHVSLNTLRPDLLRSPLPLALEIVILVMEIVHEEEWVTCPNYLCHLVQRAAVSALCCRVCV